MLSRSVSSALMSATDCFHACTSAKNSCLPLADSWQCLLWSALAFLHPVGIHQPVPLEAMQRLMQGDLCDGGRREALQKAQQRQAVAGMLPLGRQDHELQRSLSRL